MKQTRNVFLRIFFMACIFLFSCVSTREGMRLDGISLDEAIEQSAVEVIDKLPTGTRVAIVAFSSEYDNLSNYITDELIGALIDGGLEVADRRNLVYVYHELNFQISGVVSDETAVSIGKFLRAQYVITGQFVKAGDRYRYRLSGINIETAIQESSSRLNVRLDRTLQNHIADVRQTPIFIATADYGEHQNAQPKTAGVHLDRGILFASRNDNDMAIEEFTQAIRINPNFIIAYVNRGKAYTRKGMYEMAIQDYTSAIRLDPNDPDVYTNRGKAYAYIGMNDYAIEDCTIALRLDPNFRYAHFTYTTRGVAYYNKGMYEHAIKDYTQAIRFSPNYALAYHNSGTAYEKKGDYDRALVNYTQAIRLDPNYVLSYVGRGTAYFYKRMYYQAIENYTAALRLDPNLVIARDALELARRQQGR